MHLKAPRVRPVHVSMATCDLTRPGGQVKGDCVHLPVLVRGRAEATATSMLDASGVTIKIVICCFALLFYMSAAPFLTPMQ